jgi:hypothetical protein
MLLPPIFDIRKLGRYFSRELPQDKLDGANRKIEYVKEHGIIDDDEESAFAREVAPRGIKRALQKHERHQEAGIHADASARPEHIARPPKARELEPPRPEPLLLPPQADDDKDAD